MVRTSEIQATYTSAFEFTVLNVDLPRELAITRFLIRNYLRAFPFDSNVDLFSLLTLQQNLWTFAVMSIDHHVLTLHK